MIVTLPPGHFIGDIVGIHEAMVGRGELHLWSGKSLESPVF